MISIPIFIVSLCIGIFMVYIMNPNNNIIYVYPTPENVNEIQYKDNTDKCFSFESKIVKCPKNETLIESYIPQ